MSKQKPVIKAIRQLARSRLFTIEQLSLAFANGQKAHYERIRANAGKAVMIAAITAEKEILLVSEYAAGTERYELQLPKGIVEPGEETLSAANRELAEETGFAAHKLQVLQQLRVSPGYFDHVTELVLATELYTHTIGGGDEPEPLEVISWPLSQLDELLAREDFTESRSIAGLLLVSRRLLPEATTAGE